MRFQSANNGNDKERSVLQIIFTKIIADRKTSRRQISEIIYLLFIKFPFPYNMKALQTKYFTRIQVKFMLKRWSLIVFPIYILYRVFLTWSVVDERSSALGSSSGVVTMWAGIPAWQVVALVSLSKTLNQNLLRPSDVTQSCRSRMSCNARKRTQDTCREREGACPGVSGFVPWAPSRVDMWAQQIFCIIIILLLLQIMLECDSCTIVHSLIHMLIWYPVHKIKRTIYAKVRFFFSR